MEHVLICVAWPYANGPLHLGHVAGCYLPPDLQARYERMRGRRVLMVSGSDEHGTPITVSAEERGVTPQSIVDHYHAINSKALERLGCLWPQNIDARGVEYGGALFNRTSDPGHIERVRQNLLNLQDAGLFERTSMDQYYEVREDGSGRFLPDRYVEGHCPACGADGARGDQCDACGATYDSNELLNPRSKMHPEATIEVRPTEHLFYRLDLFQEVLESYAEEREDAWKPNVRAMTRQWLDMGLRPRAVTRNLEWGVPTPESLELDGTCVYVWFEAVQGYLTCAQIWAERFAKDHPDGADAWRRWWTSSEDGVLPRHIYFLGKDNIPFHTVIWPALIMGLNLARNSSSVPSLPSPGDLRLPDRIPAMEYLMLSGGQFSKSRRHAVWLPAFLDRFDPDTLRYYLTTTMPEQHDTDFTWKEFVDRVNTELIASFGNLVHRVRTLTHRLWDGDSTEHPLLEFDDLSAHSDITDELERPHGSVTDAFERQRYKEGLRAPMNGAQVGNRLLQISEPWKHLDPHAPTSEDRTHALSGLVLGWRVIRWLAITLAPFLPRSAQRTWEAIGEQDLVEHMRWEDALDWSSPLQWNTTIPVPLFERLDLEVILEQEQALAEDSSDLAKDVIGKVKGAKQIMVNESGLATVDFATFQSVELRVARVKSVTPHPDADRLYVVDLDDGRTQGRTVCAGLREHYTEDQLVGLHVIVVANLEPRKIRGVLSEGMMLAADDEAGVVRLLTVDAITPGSRVR